MYKRGKSVKDIIVHIGGFDEAFNAFYIVLKVKRIMERIDKRPFPKFV